jgi:hypothetical protein
MYMKKCLICKKDFTGNGIKYCSYECAYKVIDSRKNKKEKCREVKCIACNGKGKVKVVIRDKISDDKKKEILKLYRKGGGIREIARMLKIRNPYSVTYYIKTCNK